MPAENQTVNPSFNIKSTIAATDAHLLVFASKQGMAFAVLDKHRNMFTGISVYHFGKDAAGTSFLKNAEEVLRDEVLVHQYFDKTDIIWCTEQSIITPQSFFNRDTNAAMLDLVFGDTGEFAVKHELILKQHAYNVYRLDKHVEKLVTDKFPRAMQSHQSSLLVNLESSKKDMLYCNFYPGCVAVMLRKEYQLQVLQTFDYETPEDAAYYLLNVCSQFAVAAAETAVTASGMIDESSSLYKELYKYFLSIDFFELPDNFTYTDELKTYPAHYFSHLFATAACVL